MLEGIRMIVLLVSLFFCAWIDWKTERVSVPLLLLGGMAASRIIAFVCTGRIRFLFNDGNVCWYRIITLQSGYT